VGRDTFFFCARSWYPEPAMAGFLQDLKICPTMRSGWCSVRLNGPDDEQSTDFSPIEWTPLPGFINPAKFGFFYSVEMEFQRTQANLKQ